MSAGDIYRVTVSGLLGADVNQNVFHYQVSSSAGPTSDEAETLANVWESDALPSYLDLLSTLYSAEMIKVRGVTNPLMGFDLTITGNGAVTGEVSPAQNATVIIVRTAKFGRPYRGRISLPAQGESVFSSGSVVAGQITNVDTWMNDMDALAGNTPITADFLYGVYSKTILEFNQYTGHSVSQFAGQQSRRKPGRGA